MNNVSCTTAAGLWRLSGFIVFVSVLDTKIAVFPMDFLATCRDNTWADISFSIACVIDIDLLHPSQILGEHGRLVDHQSVPTRGIFRCIESSLPESNV